MQLPKRVAIVGAGFIAVEFAGIFATLGAEVTLVLRGDQILRGFDQDIRAHLSETLTAKGIDIRTGTEVAAIEKGAAGYSLSLSKGDALEVDLVMYATGRKPKTDGLGLEEVGVKTDPKSSAIQVDAYSKTNIDNIYAIGDCTDRINLTPVAINEGRCFAETVFRNNPLKMDYEYVPSAVFSQPPVGTVGLTEEKAKEKFGTLDIYISRFRPMKNILAGRDERTMMKLIVDRATQRVVGAHMVGPDAPEIIQGIAIAVKMGATKQDFDATVGIHPTAAEEFVTMRDKRPD
jgi:glutathione reductase (NADPH)